MAKGVYIGVDGLARKVKKMYIGVDGVARRVKKAYIGVGGVARPCWTGGELTYYGTITPLSSAVYMSAATKNKKYALFGGGQTSSGDAMNTVDAYDKSLVKTVAPAMESPKYEHSASYTTDYAIFSGGYRGLTHVDAYDSLLSRTTAPKPDVGRYRLSATHIGGFALVAGGFDVYNKVRADVDAYDNSLSKTLPTPLNEARMYMGATTVGDFALFAGGAMSNSSESVSPRSKTVDVYDKELAHTTATELSTGIKIYGATSVGKYALFLNNNDTQSSSTLGLYVYEAPSLTHTFIGLYPSFFTSRKNVAATTVEGFAIFAGGQEGGTYYTDAICVDENLTVSFTTPLSQGRQWLSAESIGNFGLFAGGASPATVNTVDAYAVI